MATEPSPEQTPAGQPDATPAAAPSTAAPATPPDAKAPTADSSPPAKEGAVTGGEKPQTPLEIVTQAVRQQMADKAAVAAPAAHPEASPDSAEAKGGQKSGESDNPPLDKQAQNFAALRAKAEAHAEKATRFDALQQFLAEAQITAEDFATGLKTMRLLKADPAAAYELLAPIVAGLELALGKRLPADLEEKVRAGLIDADTAQELASARGTAQFARNQANALQARSDAERTAFQEAEDRRTVDQAVNAIGAAVSSWEADWKASDPDYERKRQLVQDRVIAIVNLEGVAPTPEGAVEQAKRARKEVEEYLKTILPQKQPVATVTGGAGGATRPQPRNALDVVKAALGH